MSYGAESDRLHDVYGSALARALDLAAKRLRSHKGYVKYLHIQALQEALHSVFEPNWRKLLDVLDAVDNGRGAELWHEIVFGRDNWPIPIVETVSAELTQHLHNYLAGSAMLVDHARLVPLTGGESFSFEYEQRKRRTTANPEIQFIQGLRNFTLHRSLPELGYSSASGVQLDTADLLAGTRWNSESRGFIASYGQAMPLRPVVQNHHELMYELNAWLLQELLPESRAARDGASALLDVYRTAHKLLSVHDSTRRYPGRT